MSKKGRLSRDERIYIQEHQATMTPKELAKKLNRTEETVYEVLKSIPPPIQTPTHNESVNAEHQAIRADLRCSEEWKQLQTEMELKEIKFFEDSYIKLALQFGKDILHTEEKQIFLLLRFDILMHRNMVARKELGEDINRIAKIIVDTHAQYNSVTDMDDGTKEYLSTTENLLISTRAAEQSKTKEFVDLEAKHQALLRDLKSTRDQRIDKINDSKVTFLGLVKLLQEEEAQTREGEQIALVKIATNNELKRLGGQHRYLDDSIDRPFLSENTIGEK